VLSPGSPAFLAVQAPPEPAVSQARAGAAVTVPADGP
jgi:hypothetical protein